MTETYFFPVHRHAILERPRLRHQVLSDDPALILIQGGGGTGKSVAAVQLAHAYLRQQRERGEAAQVLGALWVRCEEGEVGFEKLWRRVFETLVRANVCDGDGQVQQLARGGVISTGSVIDALRDLPGHLLIVLDDAHHSLTAEVEESLLDALENVPMLNVIVTTRRSPTVLGSRRGALRVPTKRLAARDLALSQPEVNELLKVRNQSGSTESLKYVAEGLYRKSQGWPLAVHALTVEYDSALSHSEPDQHRRRAHGAFITDFADALIEGATAREKPALYACALVGETSVGLISAMLDIPGEETQEVLDHSLAEVLEVWTDEQGVNWYRLHDLVAEELAGRGRSALGEQAWRSLARRAAFALREARPETAKRMALIAGEWQLLSDLFSTGDSLTLSRAEGKKLDLASIPERIRAEYPVIGAFSIIHEYAFPIAPIRRAATGLKVLLGRSMSREAMKPGISGLTAAVLRMIIARVYGREKVAIAMADRAIECLRELSEGEIRAYEHSLHRCLNQIAITMLHAHRFDDVPSVLDGLVDQAELESAQSGAHSIALSAWSAAWCGDMPRAGELQNYAEAFELPIGWRSSYIGAGYRIAAALAALEEGDLSTAQGHIDALAEHAATIEHWPFLVHVETLIIESRAGASEALAHLEQQMKRRSSPITGPFSAARLGLDALAARLQWQSGRVVPASQKLPSAGLVGVYSAMSRSDFPVAAALAAEGIDDPTVAGVPRIRAEYLLLRAESAYRSDDLERARQYAERATSVMDRNRLSLPMRAMTRGTARELSGLIADFPVERSSPFQTMRPVQQLSRAEARALVQVVESGSIPKAAAAMHLSVNTVKAHMKQVYRKLHVRTRDEAIVVAADAGMLGDYSGRVRGDH